MGGSVLDSRQAQKGPNLQQTIMQTITERAPKIEIITAAVELADSQAETIRTLKGQQAILWGALALAILWGLA